VVVTCFTLESRITTGPNQSNDQKDKNNKKTTIYLFFRDPCAKAGAEKEEPWTPVTAPEDAEMLLLSPNVGRECDGAETKVEPQVGSGNLQRIPVPPSIINLAEGISLETKLSNVKGAHIRFHRARLGRVHVGCRHEEGRVERRFLWR